MNFYNEEAKNQFLSGVSESAADSYIKLFNNTEQFERESRKDLFDFNLRELDVLLHVLSLKSLNQVISAKNLMLKYIDWANMQGMKVTNINPLAGIDNEWFKRILNLGV